MLPEWILVLFTYHLLSEKLYYYWLVLTFTISITIQYHLQDYFSLCTFYRGKIKKKAGEIREPFHIQTPKVGEPRFELMPSDFRKCDSHLLVTATLKSSLGRSPICLNTVSSTAHRTIPGK